MNYRLTNTQDDRKEEPIAAEKDVRSEIIQLLYTYFRPALMALRPCFTGKVEAMPRKRKKLKHCNKISNDP